MSQFFVNNNGQVRGVDKMDQGIPLDYQEVYTRHEYLSFQKQQLTICFKGNFFRFQGVETVKRFMNLRTISWLKSYDHVEADLTLTHNYDRQLSGDSFRLTSNEQGQITITTHNFRGLRYALEALESLLIITDTAIHVPLITINHEVELDIRGVIEGFYGEPWSQFQRLDLLKFLGANRLNTYMYGPKDDLKQRKSWRELYDDQALADLKELNQLAEIELIDFYYMISPGNDLNFNASQDLLALEAKLSQLIAIGVRHFGLLLDDIDYTLRKEGQKRFQTAAQAQAFLTVHLNNFLKANLVDYTLVVCPTEYDNQLDSPYLAELSSCLPLEIPFFWTGPETLATQITTADLENIANIYQRPLIIWDNVPVNDYQNDSQKVFLSPYSNRSPKLGQGTYLVKGVVANPMPQWELSKVTLLSMAQFLWFPQHKKGSEDWRMLLEKLVPKEFVSALAVFIKHNPNKYLKEPLTLPLKIAIQAKNFKELTKEIEELQEAALKLKTLPNQGLLKELAPWLQRIQLDWEFWQGIIKEDLALQEKLLGELLQQPVIIGTNIPLNYYNYWQDKTFR